MGFLIHGTPAVVQAYTGTVQPGFLHASRATSQAFDEQAGSAWTTAEARIALARRVRSFT